MDTQPDYSRVITTLHHEEPDKVPLVEAVIDYEIMGQFLGRPVTSEDLAAQVEFWHQAGYDYIPLPVGMMQPGRVTEESKISQVIKDVMLQDSTDKDYGEAWNLERRAWILSERELEAFPWQEAGTVDCARFYQVQDYLPKGMKIIALSGKILTLTWLLMGFENFAINLRLNPQFVRAVMKQVAQIQLRGLRAVVGIPNVVAAWAVDDLAFGSGPMIAPKALREHVFPWYEEFGAICHQNGLHFLFHSDGLLWELMDDLIAVGVDALHPIDPTCMDIEQVKDRVGERLCIFGNIPTALLESGTPDEVTQLTRKRLKVLAPGGGYGLGSGNSVPSWARIENYRAMLETGLRYGRYPIDIK